MDPSGKPTLSAHPGKLLRTTTLLLNPYFSFSSTTTKNDYVFI